MKMTKTTILITILLTAALADVRAQMRPMRPVPIISPDSLVQTYTGRLAYTLLNRYVTRDSLDKALSGYVKTDDSRLSDSRTPTGAAGGDLTGNYPNPAIKSSVTLAGNPTVAGTLSTTDSSNKVATTAFVKKMASLGPKGLAGGDLTGTYPNPTIRKDVMLAGNPTVAESLRIYNGRLYFGETSNQCYLQYYRDNKKLFVNRGLLLGGNLTSEYNADFKGSIRIGKGCAGGTINFLDSNDIYIEGSSIGVGGDTYRDLTIKTPDQIRLLAKNVTAPTPSTYDNSINVATTAFVHSTLSSNLSNYVRTSDARLSDSRTPTGTAGGDLTGTYPNPTIKSSVTLTGNPTVSGNLTTGGTLTVNGTGESRINGNLRLKGSSAFGNKINFGNGDYVYLYEATDDNLTVKAKNIDLAPTTSVTAPTPSSSDSSDRVATTAFVMQKAGKAGGDLTGNYPNPTIKKDVVLKGNPEKTSSMRNTIDRYYTNDLYSLVSQDELMAFTYNDRLGIYNTREDLIYSPSPRLVLADMMNWKDPQYKPFHIMPYHMPFIIDASNIIKHYKTCSFEIKLLVTDVSQDKAFFIVNFVNENNENIKLFCQENMIRSNPIQLTPSWKQWVSTHGSTPTKILFTFRVLLFWQGSEQLLYVIETHEYLD